MVLSNFLVDAVLPFMLIFVVVFAVLQKAKILGEDKSQIDALVSLTIALILVFSPGPQKYIIVNLMPWLAVALSVMLTFFILYAFTAGEISNMHPWVKIGFGVLAFVFTGAVVVSLTNLDVILASWFSGTGDLFVNIIIGGVVIGGIAWVALNGKGSNSKD